MTTTTDLEIIELANGVTLRIRRRSAHHSTPGEYRAKTRVYVSDELSNRDPRVAPLAERERALGDHRHSTIGDDPEIDELYRQLNRSIGVAKREIAHAALLEAKLIGRVDKIRFSRTAGCSCPCSPGCVVDHVITRMCVPVDIWVEVAK